MPGPRRGLGGRRPTHTDEDIQTLRDLTPQVPITDIAEIIGRPKKTLTDWCKKFGLEYSTKTPRNWNDKDKARLRELVETHLAGEIAELLGRSEGGVILKAQRMGLKITKGPDPRHWTEKEDSLLHFLCATMGVKDASKRMGRSPRAIHDRCKKIGLKWNRGKRSIRSVAEDLGVHVQTVHRLANKLGLRLYVPSKNHGNVSDEVYEKLLDWWFSHSGWKIKVAA